MRSSDWSSDVCSSDLVEELEKFLPVIAEAAGADPDAVAQRYHALRERTRGGEEPTAASGGVIAYHAPADAASPAPGDGEVDVVFSNSGPEHVPEAATDPTYREAMRILAPGRQIGRPAGRGGGC